MSSSQMFLQGLNASFPIVAGYLPIGFAFGVAAEGAQFGTFSAVFVSLLIYAGASQFALVGLLKDGVPLLSVALITISLNIRHFLYGPGLSRETGGFSLSERLVAAFGLTDEVFAIAFSQIKDLPSESRFLWLMGLELVAYACWAVSTLAGSIGGNVLFNYYSFLRPALFFALPALFLSLLLFMLNKKTLLVIIISLIVATFFHWNGHSEIGIIASAFIGPGVGISVGEAYDD